MAELNVPTSASQRVKLNIREMRARRTADQLVHSLDDFIPRSCLREARHYLYDTFLKANMALIAVDARWDAYTDAQLAEAHLNTHPYVVAHPELQEHTSAVKVQDNCG